MTPDRQISRFERGLHKPTGKVHPLYQAIVWNLLVDNYHHNLVRIAWWLYRAEQGADAPEVVGVGEDFLEWASHREGHAILGELPHGLGYDPRLAWPPNVSAA